VCAIDVSPICVDLLRARGVLEAREMDIWDLVSPRRGLRDAADMGGLRGERFDTVVFGMQSIGIAGSLAGLDEMLVGLRDLLAPGGRVLLDSSAPIGTDFESFFTFAGFDTDGGRSTFTFTLARGAATMKMISRTNITSTKGVTLI